MGQAEYEHMQTVPPYAFLKKISCEPECELVRITEADGHLSQSLNIVRSHNAIAIAIAHDEIAIAYWQVVNALWTVHNRDPGSVVF